MSAVRHYGRADVDYATWYSHWMRELALNYTRAELETRLWRNSKNLAKATAAHLKTFRCNWGSSRRAHAMNAVEGASEERLAINGALEIYELFPEFTKEANE